MEKRTYSVSLRTKQRIYDTAMKLFVEQGYFNTSLKDVAAAADVSMSTIYRYFPNKGDFMAEIGFESTTHLRDFADGLPDDMGVVDKVMAILMEDVRGNLDLFFNEVEVDGRIEHHPNDLRAAYFSAYAMNADHFCHEIQSRDILAGIYQGVLERAIASGELAPNTDCATLSQIITAIFFQEDERSSYTVDYPYEAALRRKIDVLFEGKLMTQKS